MPSIKINFVYKSLLTVSNFLISFITFPYITRVLGVEKIGIVNFVDNFIGYFLLFASMGISILGTREIASVAKDKQQCSKAFFNVLGLNLLFTLVVLLVYIGAVFSVPQLEQYQELLYIGIAKILFTSFLIEWFFSGIEDFRYITIRSLLIKTLYVILVFIVIQSPEDYVLYFVLTVGTIVLNAIVNIIYVRHYLVFSFKSWNPFIYFKENVTLGSYLLLNSMYSTFNVVFLGFIAGNYQVGYYTTAFKLYSIILAFFSSFTSVMLPRMNALLAQNDRGTFNRMIGISFSLMYGICIPLILFSIIMASDIIYVIAGPGYEEAIIPMMIIMPTVFAVGLSQILAVQILTPLKKDKVLLTASVFGASVGLLLNVSLVPTFHSIGTAITLISSETIVTLVYVWYIHRKRIVGFSSSLIARNLLYALPSVLVCILCTFFIPNQIISLLAALGIGGGLWMFLNLRMPGGIVKLLFQNLDR